MRLGSFQSGPFLTCGKSLNLCSLFIAYEKKSLHCKGKEVEILGENEKQLTRCFTSEDTAFGLTGIL